MTHSRRRTLWIYAAAGLALAAALAAKGVGVVTSAKRMDYGTWHLIAGRALEGKSLANPPGQGTDGKPLPPEDDVGYYNLPPAFALYICPLGLLPYRAFAAAWYVLSVGSLVASVLLGMKIVHGRWLPDRPLALLLPLLGVLHFALIDLYAGSICLEILLLLVLGAYLSHRGRNWAGGLAVGMAAALKAYPLAILPALLLGRRWKLAGWTLLGTIAWSLIVPGAIRGYRRQWNETTWWYGRIVRPYAQRAGEMKWRNKSFSYKNHSINALVNRLLRPVHVGTDPSDGELETATMNAADLPVWAAHAAYVAIVAGLLAAMAGAYLRAGRGATRAPVALDMAVGVVFVLLASPVVWDYYYTLLLLGMCIAAERALAPGHARRRWLWPVGAATAAMIVVEICSLWARAMGILVALAAMWFVVLLVLRAGARASSLAAPSGQPHRADAVREISQNGRSC